MGEEEEKLEGLEGLPIEKMLTRNALEMLVLLHGKKRPVSIERFIRNYHKVNSGGKKLNDSDAEDHKFNIGVLAAAGLIKMDPKKGTIRSDKKRVDLVIRNIMERIAKNQKPKIRMK